MRLRFRLFRYQIFEIGWSELLTVLKCKSKTDDDQTQKVLRVVYICYLFSYELFSAQGVQITRLSMQSPYLTNFRYTFYWRISSSRSSIMATIPEILLFWLLWNLYILLPKGAFGVLYFIWDWVRSTKAVPCNSSRCISFSVFTSLDWKK